MMNLLSHRLWDRFWQTVAVITCLLMLGGEIAGCYGSVPHGRG
jgi:hypothetical protein